MSRSAFPPASDRCAHHAPTLLTLFDGQTLDVALLELSDARDHLQGCSACQKQWRDWQLTRDALRQTTPPPPAGLGQRVVLAVRLRAPFESVPTPPPGLREAILRATIGVKNAVQAINPAEESGETSAGSEQADTNASTSPALTAGALTVQGTVPQNFAPHHAVPLTMPAPILAGEEGAVPASHLVPTSHLVGELSSRRARRGTEVGHRSRSGRGFRARAATAWLTPALAAWLIVLSTQGQPGGADIELPTVHSTGSLRQAARVVKARAAHALTRLHLGAAHASRGLPGSVARIPASLVNQTPAAPTSQDGAPSGATAEQTARDENHTTLAPRVENWHEAAHHEGEARHERETEDRSGRDEERSLESRETERTPQPRFQLAGWHPSRAEEASVRRVEVEEAPTPRLTARTATVRVSNMRLAAPALSSVPERRMNGARGGTQLASTGNEDSPRTVPGRALPLASRLGFGRRLNVSTSVRVASGTSSGTSTPSATPARLTGTRFAPTRVASPQLVSRVPLPSDAEALNDADTPPLRLSDHRPAEISQVMDDFRAVLDEEE